MVGRFFDWLMKERRTETVRIETTLSAEEVRERLQEQIIEMHHFVIFGYFPGLVFSKRPFFGHVVDNHFELQVIHSSFGSYIHGKIHDGKTVSLSFESTVNLIAETAAIIWGAYLVMGVVFGLIVGIFIPVAWSFIFYIWGISIALFLGLVGLKALSLHFLPQQHARNKVLL